MKRPNLALLPGLTGALMLLLAMPLLAEPREFTIDPDQFSIVFKLDHVGYNDRYGMFLEGSGRFVYDEEANHLEEGEVVIRAESVFTNHERRDDHVRNRDFLHVRRHSEIRFVATEWAPEADRHGTLHGDLTLLGQTHPVSLDVRINRIGEYPFGHEKHTIGISASTTIERSRWGMDYGIEDGMVGDEVDLMFEFEALAED